MPEPKRRNRCNRRFNLGTLGENPTTRVEAQHASPSPTAFSMERTLRLVQLPPVEAKQGMRVVPSFK